MSDKSVSSVATSVEDGEYFLVLDTGLDELILPELTVMVEVKGLEKVASPPHHRLLVEARGLVQGLEDLNHLLNLDGAGAISIKHLECPPRFLISGATRGHVSGEHEFLKEVKTRVRIVTPDFHAVKTHSKGDEAIAVRVEYPEYLVNKHFCTGRGWQNHLIHLLYFFSSQFSIRTIVIKIPNE